MLQSHSQNVTITMARMIRKCVFNGSKEPIQSKLSYIDYEVPSDPEDLYRSQV